MPITARMPAKFVVFEGPHGVGKSTTSAAFVEMLRERHLPVVLTTEPTHSAFGDALRSAEAQLSGRALALAVAADRAWHLEHEVEPALTRGDWVVSDRYLPSSLVLQRIDEVPTETIWDINQPLRVPDLTIFLTASAETLRSRLGARSSLTRLEEGRDIEREQQYYSDARNDIAKLGWPVAQIASEGDSSDVVEAAFRVLETSFRH